MPVTFSNRLTSTNTKLPGSDTLGESRYSRRIIGGTMRIKLGAGLCLAILAGPLLLSTPAHAEQVCQIAPNGSQYCYDDGTGPGSGEGSGVGGGNVGSSGSGAPGAVPPPPPPVVAPPAPAPAPPILAPVPAPAPAPGTVEVGIVPRYQAPQGPAQSIPVPDQNVRQSPLAEAPGAQAGITNPDAPAETGATGEATVPPPTDQAAATESDTAIPAPTSSNTVRETVIRAETASASFDVPNWQVLVFAVAGILVIGGAGAYYFLLRPRHLGRRTRGGPRA